jgi:hypothetical protein
MWSMISSLQPIVDVLAPAFTQPSAITSANFFLGWIMCLGNRTIFRVCKSANPQTLHDNSQRHGFDGYYNFFERSAWTPAGLAYRVALLIIDRCAANATELKSEGQVGFLDKRGQKVRMLTQIYHLVDDVVAKPVGVGGG